MKKLLCLILTALLLLPLLAGCSKPEDSLADELGYQLVREDGNYYVQMAMFKEAVTDIPPGIIHYTSLEEMISDLKTGSFTRDEFVNLARQGQSQDGKIKVPNLDALVEPIVPDFLGIYEVQQERGQYSFQFENPENASNIKVTIFSKLSYDNKVDTFVKYGEQYAYRDRFVIEQVSDRNATVYTWVLGGQAEQCIQYTISANETVYYVREDYADAESGVLDALYIWFEYQGEYIYIYVNDPEERPSVEWITSFAVKPYEG